MTMDMHMNIGFEYIGWILLGMAITACFGVLGLFVIHKYFDQMGESAYNSLMKRKKK